MDTLQKIYRNENLFSFGLHLPFRHFHRLTTEVLKGSNTVVKVAAYILASCAYIWTGALLAIAMVIRAPQHFLSTKPYKDCFFFENVDEHFQDAGRYKKSLETWKVYFQEYNPQITVEMQKKYLEEFICGLTMFSSGEIVAPLLDFLSNELKWDVTSMRFGERGDKNLLHCIANSTWLKNKDDVGAVVAKLVELGIDPNEQEDNHVGAVPLSYLGNILPAEVEVRIAIVDALIKAGADVNKGDKSCSTPLHYIVRRTIGPMPTEDEIPEAEPHNDFARERQERILPVVKVLLSKGANPDISNASDNISAREFAINKGLALLVSAFNKHTKRNDQRQEA